MGKKAPPTEKIYCINLGWENTRWRSALQLMPTNSQELQRIWNTRGKGNYYPIKPQQLDVTAAVVTGIEHQSN